MARGKERITAYHQRWTFFMLKERSGPLQLQLYNVGPFTVTIYLPCLESPTENRDCSHKAQADLLSAEHCLPCTWDQTSQSQFPSSSYRHGMSSQSLCCRKWNTTLIPVLGLIKELIKLHTFPKSCLESSQPHSLLS